MPPATATEAGALYSTLAHLFDVTHTVMDGWGQPSWAAAHKGTYGDHQVYLADGVPVGEEPAGENRTGWHVVTATQLGQIACTLHVALYSAGQLAAASVASRALGYRVPFRHLAANALTNGAWHWIIDRRAPLYRAADTLGKTEFIQRCTVVRTPGGKPQETGPGTGLMMLDDSAHRAIGAVTLIRTVRAILRHR